MLRRRAAPHGLQARSDNDVLLRQAGGRDLRGETSCRELARDLLRREAVLGRRSVLRVELEVDHDLPRLRSRV